MKDLQKAFLKTTGLTFSIEKKLKNAKTEEEKEKIFKKLSWQMHKGGLTQNNTSEVAKQYANLIISLSKELNLSEEIISNLKEIKEANEILSANSIEIKNGISTEEELLLAIESQSEIILDSNIILSNYVEIRDKEITINLNGYSITHPASSSATYKDVFETYGTAKLIIEGNGQVIAEDGYCVYAAGDSSVILNGGKYLSPVSCIDARKNAIVTINNGEYKVDGSNNPDGDFGQKYTLNLRDKTGKYESELANFIVKGGKFFNFDPSKSEAEPTITNFVEDGYKVIKNGDWFEVKK